MGSFKFAAPMKIIRWFAVMMMVVTNVAIALAISNGGLSDLSFVILLPLLLTSLGIMCYLVYKLLLPERSSAQIDMWGIQKDPVEVTKCSEKSVVKTTDACDQEFLKQRMAEGSTDIESNKSFAMFNLGLHNTYTSTEAEAKRSALFPSFDSAFATRPPCLAETQCLANAVYLETEDEHCVTGFTESRVLTGKGKEPEPVHAGGKCIYADSVSNIPPKSRLSRSGRRHFAAILDVFWGHLFNLHGNLTVKAKIMQADTVFGLNTGVVFASVREMGESCPTSFRNYDGTDLPSSAENNAQVDYKFCRQPAVSELRKLIISSFFHEGGALLDDAAISSLLKQAYDSCVFDGHGISENYEYAASQSTYPTVGSKSIWGTPPLEGFFTKTSTARKCEESGAIKEPLASKNIFSYVESKRYVLHSLRICIRKLVCLEGSDWLFSQGGGYDEQLIDLLATAEWSKQRKGNSRMRRNLWINEEASAYCWPFLPGCGPGCTWQTNLVVSFGVWCIRRVLELLFEENRPELWGKYTYVLNRLQGILHLAFLKPRKPIALCGCIMCPDMTVEEFEQIAGGLRGLQCASAGLIFQMVKDVEDGVSRRRGRAGTAAGDVAFPKGKQNVSSVLKRYKRQLPKENSGGE